jgi:hypothetical protein
MFFAKTLTTGAEVLCIFGPLPARRGAELKVMSSVEHKHNGYCLNEKKELRKLERALGDEDPPGWGLDTVPLSDEDFSYALGSQGVTRRKLAHASGCIIEYVGRLACFVRDARVRLSRKLVPIFVFTRMKCRNFFSAET